MTWRQENGMQHILSKTKLAILSPKTRLAELIIQEACLDCQGQALGQDVGENVTIAENDLEERNVSRG